jgi:hypothetical protein
VQAAGSRAARLAWTCRCTCPKWPCSPCPSTMLPLICLYNAANTKPQLLSGDSTVCGAARGAASLPTASAPASLLAAPSSHVQLLLQQSYSSTAGNAIITVYH